MEERCIVCGKKLEPDEDEECKTCKMLLDAKYKGNKKARERSKKFFRWLKKSKGGKPK